MRQRLSRAFILILTFYSQQKGHTPACPFPLRSESIVRTVQTVPIILIIMVLIVLILIALTVLFLFVLALLILIIAVLIVLVLMIHFAILLAIRPE